MIYRGDINRALSSSEVDSNFRELEEKIEAIALTEGADEFNATKEWVGANFLTKLEANGATLVNISGLNDEFYYKKTEVDNMLKQIIDQLKTHNITITLEGN